MPLTLDGSNVRRCVLFSTNSATNLSNGVDTCGSSAKFSIARSNKPVCLGYIQSNSKPYVLRELAEDAMPRKSRNSPMSVCLTSWVRKVCASVAASLSHKSPNGAINA